MIITNVCLLLEALSIVICLHHLYGEKFRVDIVTVIFLSISMIIMTAINYYGLPKTYLVTIVIYPIIALYCGIRFGFKLKPMISNIVLCIILVGGMQMMGMLFSYYLFNVQDFSDLYLLILNCTTFLFIIIVLHIFKMNRLSQFSQDNGKIVIIVISVCVVRVAFLVLGYKNFKLLELRQAILLVVSIGLLIMMAGQLSKYKIRAKEIETELKMHELYSESFQGLIDDIRIRQHEFDNHINAIYGQHFACHTFEELVGAQRNYCEQITKDNRFNKLLSHDNSVIRGYLYTRFVEIDKMGINVSYQVCLKEFNVGVPIYKIIEILGDLINNAVEALEADEERNELNVSILMKDKIYIEVRNESPYITYDVLSKFFNKGYSKKGENRGLGLYNVKQICDEYGLEFASECQEIDGKNWILFKVWKKDQCNR